MGRWSFSIAARIMKRALLTAIALFSLTLTASADEATTQIFYASAAFDSATGDLVYTEKHHYVEIGKDLQSAQVEYFSPDGMLLAVKNIDFTTSPESPFFERDNKQTGYREGYEAVSKTQPYQGRLFQQKAGESATCNNVIALRPGMIVDAGFNVHLQNNLVALAAGQTLTFDLLIPKACRALEFMASATRSEKGLLVSLKPTNFLARLIVPNTEVLYNAETATLLEYHGLSDLTDTQGRSMKVSIYFEAPVIRQGAEVPAASKGQDPLDGTRTNNTQAFNNGRD